jgi:hypothetical protein
MAEQKQDDVPDMTDWDNPRMSGKLIEKSKEKTIKD